MKSLLQHALKQLSIFAFVMFALSIPAYFLLIDWIWLHELDENNALIARRIEKEFNAQQISDEKLDEYISFWNEVQPVSSIELSARPMLQDSIYTITRQHIDLNEETDDRFRGLKKSIKINEKFYILQIENNIEESEETVAYISMLTFLFFLLLIVGFWMINTWFSQRLWQPFQNTLRQLKSFRLNSEKLPHFSETTTLEFVELNATLSKLMQQSMRTYQQQKEFTENASHELQTPLAVLKNKLDILMQTDELTQRQYLIAEEMNKALLRSSRINKNLLLLTKIENHQFKQDTMIQLDLLIIEIVDGLQAHFIAKNIAFSMQLQEALMVKGNPDLLEIMLSNLIVNAIRHTARGGYIRLNLSNTSFQCCNSGEKALDKNLLFKRFAKMSEDNSGTGLGLSIVYEICRLQDWQIRYRFEQMEHHFEVHFIKTKKF